MYNKLALLFLAAVSANGFTTVAPCSQLAATASITSTSSSLWAASETNGEDVVVDVAGNEVMEEEDEAAAASVTDLREETSSPLPVSGESMEALSSLMQIAATTGRGEFATSTQKESACTTLTPWKRTIPLPILHNRP